MGKQCFSCGIKLGWKDPCVPIEGLSCILEVQGFHDEVVDRMTKKDVLCNPCRLEFDKRNAVEVWKFIQKGKEKFPQNYENIINNPENKEWIEIAKQKLSLTESSDDAIKAQENSEFISRPNTSDTIVNEQSTSVEKLNGIIASYSESFKKQWDKNGVVQFKNDQIAILQRMWGQQVQFIVAYDQLTREGYRLMAIDEGKSGGQSSGGFTGGVNAYFYFQRIKFVRLTKSLLHRFSF